MPRQAVEKFVNELTALLTRLPDGMPGDSSQKKRLALRGEVLSAVETLNSFARKLDPIDHPDEIFDPSDPSQMGMLIADTLLKRERLPLDGLRRFYGSGVYAIYYGGDFPAYRPIRGTDVPIYVGKVDPADRSATTPIGQQQRLWQRLSNEHARSIKSAENLDVADFTCRYLVVVSAWQTTAETHLINAFKPVWNEKVCDGFGKHGDNAETRANRRSSWDELHPGRRWAGSGNRPNLRTAKVILSDIAKHFEKYPPRR
jgi:hypothetical protein